jgi:hypothetical protein
LSVLLAGCATIPAASGRPIEAEDLPRLKGRWEGYWMGRTGQHSMTLVVDYVHPGNPIGSLTREGTEPQGRVISYSARLEDGKLVHRWGAAQGGRHLTFTRYNPETEELFGTTVGGFGGIEGAAYLKKQK